MGSSKYQTVGYKYFMGIHKVLCTGPVDKVMQITIDDKVAWEGLANENTEIDINKPDLFGGKSVEGGFVGKIDIAMGGDAQQQNPYLVEKVGDLVPAYRGVLSAILKHVYYAMNPQIKNIFYKVSRIHTKEHGKKQWYDEKAEIKYSGYEKDNLDAGLTMNSSGWSYKMYHGSEHGMYDSNIYVTGMPYADFSNINDIPEDWHHNSVMTFSDKNMDFKNDFLGTDKFGRQRPFLIYGTPTLAPHKLPPPSVYGYPERSNTVCKYEIWKGQSTGTAISCVIGKEFYFYGDLDKGFELEVYSPFTYRFWINQVFYQPTSPEQPNTNFIPGVSKLTIKRYLRKPRDPVSPSNPWVGLKLGRNLIFFDLSNVISSYGAVEPFYFSCNGIIETSENSNPDMNPAHIIRECLTESWGLGYSDDVIDEDSFRKAADTLYKERLGISTILDTQVEIKDFLNTIYQHINATLYTDRNTGKFVLKLIRDDYDVDDLLVLNEKNVRSVSDYSKVMATELTNSVTVTYTNASIYEPSTITVQDIALQNSNGGSVVSVAKNYEGFTNPDVASRVAQRDLKTLSSPIVSCSIEASNVAGSLNVGDCFILDWPEYSNDSMVMRVNAINYGSSKDYSVKIKCLQDVFKESDTSISSPDKPIWENPISDPKPATPTVAFELPYFSLARQLGQDNVDNALNSRPDIGYVGCAGGRPSSDAINAKMYINHSATAYSQSSSLDFMPTAKLAEAVTEMTTVFKIKNGVNLNLVEVGNFLQIDNEIIGIVSITTTEVTVKRGCLDTIPAKHNLDGYLMFWENYAGYDTTEFVTNEVINVKICPITLRGELNIDLAPVDTVTIKGRAYRPYPPANVKFNGQYFPEYIKGEKITVTWVHRNRVQQTSGMIGFTDGNITPEVGTSYVISFYGETGELKKTYETTSNTQAWDTEQTDCGFTDRLNNRIKVTIQSKRDNVLSMQTYSHEIIRVGYGYSYGIYYGGL
jgi:hypothetical protein